MSIDDRLGRTDNSSRRSVLPSRQNIRFFINPHPDINPRLKIRTFQLERDTGQNQIEYFNVAVWSIEVTNKKQFGFGKPLLCARAWLYIDNFFNNQAALYWRTRDEPQKLLLIANNYVKTQTIRQNYLTNLGWEYGNILRLQCSGQGLDIYSNFSRELLLALTVEDDNHLYLLTDHYTGQNYYSSNDGEIHNIDIRNGKWLYQKMPLTFTCRFRFTGENYSGGSKTLELDAPSWNMLRLYEV